MRVYRLKELQKLTGFSDEELQSHLALLSRILAKGIRFTSRHSVLLEDSALALLERMAELGKQGSAARRRASASSKEPGGRPDSDEDVRVLWQELSRGLRFRG